MALGSRGFSLWLLGYLVLWPVRQASWWELPDGKDLFASCIMMTRERVGSLASHGSDTQEKEEAGRSLCIYS